MCDLDVFAPNTTNALVKLDTIAQIAVARFAIEKPKKSDLILKWKTQKVGARVSPT